MSEPLGTPAEAPVLAADMEAGVRRDFAKAKAAFEGLAGWLGGLEEGLRFAPEPRGQVKNWRLQLAELARQADDEANSASKKLLAEPMTEGVDDEHAARVLRLRESA